jgi:hypothetical protein
MIEGAWSNARRMLCVVLALGCGGRAETQTNTRGGGSGAPSGTSAVPPGGEGGTGGASDEMSGAAGTDTCLGKVCDAPPSNTCASGVEFLSYDKTGSCSEGVCSYVSHQTACPCQNGVCATDACIGISCASPPSATCTGADGNTRTTYAASGTCSLGSCSYAPTNKPCQFGCIDGACQPDPCAGVTCNAQPASVCKTAAIATTYAAKGTCSAGACSYASADTACGSNQACAGAGVCSECKADASCGAACTACGGGTPKCNDLGTTSQCVGCLSNADCSAAAPICDATTKLCVTPSCVGLAATCGPNGDSNCCASGACNPVPAVLNHHFTISTVSPVVVARGLRSSRWWSVT